MQWKPDVHEATLFMLDICLPQPLVCSIYILQYSEKERSGVRNCYHIPFTGYEIYCDNYSFNEQQYGRLFMFNKTMRIFR